MTAYQLNYIKHVLLPRKPLCRKSRDKNTKSNKEIQWSWRNDPSTEDFYVDSLLSKNMKKCAFVAQLFYKNGKRCYKELQKECLPNFINFIVYKENQKYSFYYAIILIFKEDKLVNKL